MIVETWKQILVPPFNEMWSVVIGFVPNLVIAILIILIGWLIGVLIERVVSQVVTSIKLDEGLKKAGLGELLGKGGISLHSGNFIGILIKWFVIVIFLVAALDILQLQQVTIFLQEVVLGYIPQVIIAVLILLAATVIGDVMQRIVTASAKTAGVSSANFLGSITKWSIWVFSFLVAIAQLSIAEIFSQTLFTGVVIALSLALGLSFGLGGQDAAKGLIDKIRGEMTPRR